MRRLLCLFILLALAAASCDGATALAKNDDAIGSVIAGESDYYSFYTENQGRLHFGTDDSVTVSVLGSAVSEGGEAQLLIGPGVVCAEVTGEAEQYHVRLDFEDICPPAPCDPKGSGCYDRDGDGCPEASDEVAPASPSEASLITSDAEAINIAFSEGVSAEEAVKEAEERRVERQNKLLESFEYDGTDYVEADADTMLSMAGSIEDNKYYSCDDSKRLIWSHDYGILLDTEITLSEYVDGGFDNNDAVKMKLALRKEQDFLSKHCALLMTCSQSFESANDWMYYSSKAYCEHFKKDLDALQNFVNDKTNMDADKLGVNPLDFYLHPEKYEGYTDTDKCKLLFAKSPVNELTTTVANSWFEFGTNLINAMPTESMFFAGTSVSTAGMPLTMFKNQLSVAVGVGDFVFSTPKFVSDLSHLAVCGASTPGMFVERDFWDSATYTTEDLLYGMAEYAGSNPARFGGSLLAGLLTGKVPLGGAKITPATVAAKLNGRIPAEYMPAASTRIAELLKKNNLPLSVLDDSIEGISFAATPEEAAGISAWDAAMSSGKNLFGGEFDLESMSKSYNYLKDNTNGYTYNKGGLRGTPSKITVNAFRAADSVGAAEIFGHELLEVAKEGEYIRWPGPVKEILINRENYIAGGGDSPVLRQRALNYVNNPSLMGMDLGKWIQTYFDLETVGELSRMPDVLKALPDSMREPFWKLADIARKALEGDGLTADALKELNSYGPSTGLMSVKAYEAGAQAGSMLEKAYGVSYSSGMSAADLEALRTGANIILGKFGESALEERTGSVFNRPNDVNIRPNTVRIEKSGGYFTERLQIPEQQVIDLGIKVNSLPVDEVNAFLETFSTYFNEFSGGWFRVREIEMIFNGDATGRELDLVLTNSKGTGLSVENGFIKAKIYAQSKGVRVSDLMDYEFEKIYWPEGKPSVLDRVPSSPPSLPAVEAAPVSYAVEAQALAKRGFTQQRLSELSGCLSEVKVSKIVNNGDIAEIAGKIDYEKAFPKAKGYTVYRGVIVKEGSRTLTDLDVVLMKNGKILKVAEVKSTLDPAVPKNAAETLSNNINAIKSNWDRMKFYDKDNNLLSKDTFWDIDTAERSTMGPSDSVGFKETIKLTKSELDDIYYVFRAGK